MHKYQLGFGRPAAKRADRLYFVARSLDYNSIIRAYMIANQEITCDSCAKNYEITMLPALKMLKMRCPDCFKGTCQVVNLSRKYGDMLNAIMPELLLPETELNILQTLHTEKRDMVASEIASELDCSGQLVGRRARNLSEKSLISRLFNGQVYKYVITPQAESAYFGDSKSADLNIDPVDGQA